MNQIVRPTQAKRIGYSVCPHDCPSICALEVETLDGTPSAVRADPRTMTILHVKLFDGVRRGVLIAESIWPNAAYADRCGINSLTGADPIAPYGGAALHDNKVWARRA